MHFIQKSATKRPTMSNISVDENRTVKKSPTMYVSNMEKSDGKGNNNNKKSGKEKEGRAEVVMVAK